MFNQSFKQILLSILVALLLITMPVYAVRNFKISNYGGGHQIWFEAEDYDERNPDTDQYYPVVDAVDAFGQAITRSGGSGGMIRWTFDIGKADGKKGTWFFWARVLNPDNLSDYMLVEGDPDDAEIPTGPPFPGGDGTPPFVNEDDRIFERTDDVWAWWGNDEGSTKELQDGENTMYIFDRQGDDTVFWDVFVWTDSVNYVPTDEDYQNAIIVPLGSAYDPNPANGVLYEDIWVSLSWSAGDTAISHDVYFGENFDDVNDGVAETFQGNQPSVFFVVGFPGMPYPDGLVPGTTYYWRVDEVEADGTTVHKGDVWRFTIPPRIAYDPNPADGIEFVETDVELSWMTGLGAKLHHVYFGDNFNDVNSGAGDTYKGPFTDVSYSPGTLELDKTYYWRVDEFALSGTYKGDIWSFETLPVIPIIDPHLVGWWTLDEGMGALAVDWSGHDNHGRITGTALSWIPDDGMIGGALSFDGTASGTDYVEISTADISLAAGTVAMWGKIRPNPQSPATRYFFGHTTIPAFSDRIQLYMDNSDTMLDLGLGDSHDRHTDIMSLTTETWYHVALIWDGGRYVVYVNGEEKANGSYTGLDTLNPVADIGNDGDTNGRTEAFNGLLDNVRIYDYALSQAEITMTMRGDPLLAWNPKPANDSILSIDEVTAISWSPGDNAAQHDVYLGTDRDAVADANSSDTTGIYRGRQGATFYTPPEGIQWDQSHYWRIDEYNTDATITKGRIWSFAILDFLVIEDFEDYNDTEPDRIFDVWIDGWGTTTNGSTVGYPDPDWIAGEHYIETTIVHGGDQSMPYFYDNNFKYSEATKTLSYPRDWTKHGVGVLSLWFRGNPAGFLEEPAGTYTMTGAGSDIWNEADEFRYAYKQLSGDGSIVAQVLSVENTDPWAKAGVMIRKTLDAGSVNAMAYITPDGRAGWQYRVGDGGSSSSTRSDPGAITAPHWVKLTRQGNTITAQHSSDGVNWEDMVEAANPQEPSSRNILMNQNVYIGLALTSHSSGVVCKAELSNVQTTGTVTPIMWTHEAIGVDMAANDPEPMYVALNGSAVVYHDDPGAALIDTWTPWTVDLQKFAAQGVNLANVNTISIGFGDKNNIQAGGSGLVFFDDIRLYRPEEQ
jgi:hypothetical protein